MIQRRAKAVGIQTRIGNHTFRATGITAYLVLLMLIPRPKAAERALLKRGNYDARN